MEPTASVRVVVGPVRTAGVLPNGCEIHQGSIALNLTEHTYQRLDTYNGFFLVIVTDAVPELTGYKLRFKIGNPLYAKYSGFKVKIR
jgi:hypothetical protein